MPSCAELLASAQSLLHKSQEVSHRAFWQLRYGDPNTGLLLLHERSQQRDEFIRLLGLFIERCQAPHPQPAPEAPLAPHLLTVCANCARPYEFPSTRLTSPTHLEGMPAFADSPGCGAKDEYYVCSLECAVALIDDILMGGD
jgi:hypothetical protein